MSRSALSEIIVSFPLVLMDCVFPCLFVRQPCVGAPSIRHVRFSPRSAAPAHAPRTRIVATHILLRVGDNIPMVYLYLVVVRHGRLTSECRKDSSRGHRPTQLIFESVCYEKTRTQDVRKGRPYRATKWPGTTPKSLSH